MGFLQPQFFAIIGAAIIVLLLLVNAIHIIKEYERGVIFRLGRLIGSKGPGLIIIIPIVDRIVRVTLRTVVFDVPVQEVITRDNVTCKVNAVLYYRVVEPTRAIVNVQKFHEATIQLSQTTLRSVVGEADLDELLSEREKLNQKLQQIIDEATDPWGIKVSAVEIKDVTIPEQMQRVIGRQAEAERRRRAIVIQAEGEKQAAVRLAEAAEILSRQQGGLTLRTLRTAYDISSEKSSNFFFPLPMELGGILSNMGLGNIMQKQQDNSGTETEKADTQEGQEEDATPEKDQSITEEEDT